jgi:hypothetical protein
MNIEDLGKILSLSQEEKEILENNQEMFIGKVNELLEAHSEYMENLREKAFLHGRIASLIFDSYEQFMRVHEYTIMLSARVADLRMQGIMGREEDREISYFLDRYLVPKNH